MTADDIEQQQELLFIHRRTLSVYLRQQAELGTAYVPPAVANGIREVRAAIHRIKGVLRRWGVPVDNYPDDEESAVAQPATSGLSVLRQPSAQIANLDRTLGSTVPHQLKAPVADFVGRKREIDQFVQEIKKVAKRGTAPAIGGIWGMGGVGKTEMAYKTAQRLAPFFPDGQVLVELRGMSRDPILPVQALQAIISTFNREIKLSNDLTELQCLYHTTLVGKRLLILADDAKDAKQIRPLTPPAGCALLITSRRRFRLPGMMEIDLGTLSASEAEKLVLNICPRVDNFAERLAKLCGRLPLALWISSQNLATDDTLRVERYLERLECERLPNLRDPDDTESDVEASLALSYDDLDPIGQAMLRQLSVFPASFDLAAVIAVVDIADVEQTLSLLRRRNLVEWDIIAERYNLHELVRVFAAMRLQDAEAVRLRHARHYAQIILHANTLYQQGGEYLLEALSLLGREITHITTSISWAYDQTRTQDVTSLLQIYTDALDLLRASAFLPRLGAVIKTPPLATSGSKLIAHNAIVTDFTVNSSLISALQLLEGQLLDLASASFRFGNTDFAESVGLAQQITDFSGTVQEATTNTHVEALDLLTGVAAYLAPERSPLPET